MPPATACLNTVAGEACNFDTTHSLALLVHCIDTRDSDIELFQRSIVESSSSHHARCLAGAFGEAGAVLGKGPQLAGIHLNNTRPDQAGVVLIQSYKRRFFCAGCRNTPAAKTGCKDLRPITGPGLGGGGESPIPASGCRHKRWPHGIGPACCEEGHGMKASLHALPRCCSVCSTSAKPCARDVSARGDPMPLRPPPSAPGDWASDPAAAAMPPVLTAMEKAPPHV